MVPGSTTALIALLTKPFFENNKEIPENMDDVQLCLNDVVDQICNTGSTQFDYANASNFTSEIYKIQISNLPKYLGFGEFKKQLKRILGFYCHKMKHIRHFNKVYVTFKNEKQREIAIEKLNGYNYKGKKLEVRTAKPQEDAMLKRNIQDDNEKNGCNKKSKPDHKELTAKEVVSPWSDILYEEQLKSKQKTIHKILRKYIENLQRTPLQKQIKNWINQQKSVNDGSFMPIREILPSPATTHYRNKCEFTVGMNDEGIKTVGFRLKRYINHSCAVGDVNELIIINETMKTAVKIFESYVRASNKDAYNPQDYKGHWRQLTVRTNQSGDALAIVMVSEQSETDPEAIKMEKEELSKIFSVEESPVKSLLYIRFPTHHPPAGVPLPQLETIFGEGVLYEEILNLKFRISPDAFFQCNTLAAVTLYTTIGYVLQNLCYNESNEEKEKNNELENVVLFDVCCGTGTIGLSLASQVKKVIGVEMCEPAVLDATKNAELNGINNVEFHCGKAEDLLNELIYAEQRSCEKDVQFVAVVDPPRPGTHPNVIRALRRCPKLNKLIYVSCNPAACNNNFIDLSRSTSKRLQGDPFQPVIVQPVDMFPHTPHCELIVGFKRIQIG